MSELLKCQECGTIDQVGPVARCRCGSRQVRAFEPRDIRVKPCKGERVQFAVTAFAQVRDLGPLRIVELADGTEIETNERESDILRRVVRALGMVAA